MYNVEIVDPESGVNTVIQQTRQSLALITRVSNVNWQVYTRVQVLQIYRCLKLRLSFGFNVQNKTVSHQSFSDAVKLMNKSESGFNWHEDEDDDSVSVHTHSAFSVKQYLLCL